MSYSQTLIASWARVYKALISNHKTAAFALSYLELLQAQTRPRASVERIVASHPKAERLTKAEIKAFAAAAREDWKAVRAEQADLLAHRSRSTMELSEQFPGKRTAATPHEAGEDLRPRFADVRDDFISHHTNSTGEWAIRLAKALARRGRSSWLAQQQIQRPSLWNDDLSPAIANCAEFILMMNSAAAQSTRVRGECIRAVDHKRRVIAIELEPGIEPATFDIGFLAMQVCVIKWHRGLDTDEDAAELAHLIVSMLQEERDWVAQAARRKTTA